MAYFTKDYLKFFKELKQNNTKEWFDINRKRYETTVKKPFAIFVDEMIGRINEIEPDIRIQAKDAVTRINRDIRFSPDKTPYNTHLGAIISTAGRKDKTVPGLWFRFTPTNIDCFGGAYGIDKDQLLKIREAIAYDLKGFQKLITEKKFVARYGEIQGEKHKRIPKEFQEVAKKQPLIANKYFYYHGSLPVKHILDDDLPDIISEYWMVAKPVKDFLISAMAY